MRYLVTQEVIVEAQNPRHAAHIAQGMQKSNNITLDRYKVEPMTTLTEYRVDLSKEKGERGYQEVV